MDGNAWQFLLVFFQVAHKELKFIVHYDRDLTILTSKMVGTAGKTVFPERSQSKCTEIFLNLSEVTLLPHNGEIILYTCRKQFCVWAAPVQSVPGLLPHLR